MRLLVQFDQDITLPLHEYNHAIQSFIYSNLKEDFAKFLHEKGFTFGKRKFKLFVFSRLAGRAKVKEGMIKILAPVELKISSPLPEFINGLVNTLLKRKVSKLGENLVEISQIEVLPMPQFKQRMRIEMLSPLTVSSTVTTPSGKKKRYFYSPKEKEWSENILANLKRKYKAYYGRLPRGELTVLPYEVKNKDLIITRFKEGIIKGWLGKYTLIGSKELIKWGYLVGLGARNAQGFGMFEILD
mgnify:CR=1 FL=1